MRKMSLNWNLSLEQNGFGHLIGIHTTTCTVNLIDYLRFYVSLKNFSRTWRRHHYRSPYNSQHTSIHSYPTFYNEFIYKVPAYFKYKCGLFNRSSWNTNCQQSPKHIVYIDRNTYLRIYESVQTHLGTTVDNHLWLNQPTSTICTSEFGMPMYQFILSLESQ
jgi:hypothetical protein